MKNNHIIIKNNLTKVVLLYQQKKLFIKKTQKNGY
jgi:hypothetical protein